MIVYPPLEILFDCCFDIVPATKRTLRREESFALSIFIFSLLMFIASPSAGPFPLAPRRGRGICKSKEGILNLPHPLSPSPHCNRCALQFPLLFVASWSSLLSRSLVVRCSKPLKLDAITKNLKKPSNGRLARDLRPANLHL